MNGIFNYSMWTTTIKSRKILQLSHRDTDLNCEWNQHLCRLWSFNYTQQLTSQYQADLFLIIGTALIVHTSLPKHILLEQK